MPSGYTYILLCEDNNLYTGSTINIEKRFIDHQNGEGSNFTKTHPPIRIVYLEKHKRIDKAFEREKQIQRWRRAKKIALIEGNYKQLKALSIPYRDIKIGKL